MLRPRAYYWGDQTNANGGVGDEGRAASANATAEGQPTMDDVQTNANGEAGNEGYINGGSTEEEQLPPTTVVTEATKDSSSVIQQSVVNEASSILHNVVDETRTMLVNGTGGLQLQAIGKAESKLGKAVGKMKTEHMKKLDADEQKIKDCMLESNGVFRKAMQEIDSEKKRISNEYDCQLTRSKQHLREKITAEIAPSTCIRLDMSHLTVGLVSGIVCVGLGFLGQLMMEG